MKYMLVFFMFLSCSGGSKHKVKDVKVDSLETMIINRSDTDRTNKLPIDELTIGVMSLKEDASGRIEIYNEDGKLWRTFPLDEALNKKINPYSINIDYQNLVFRAVDQTKSFYKVIVDDESGLTKYIKKADAHFDFETWDRHILKAFSVDFKESENPVRESPSDNSAIADYNKDEFYHPVEVKGDWLRIKWGDSDDEKYGWIKWKTGNRLLVGIFYTA